MALSDKNIVITPNISSSTDDPKIVFSGADSTTGAQNITLKAYPTNSGTLSFEGSAGQLFSISNSLSGTIFSVNDVSGIPSIEVLDTGTVRLAQYSGNVGIGTSTPTQKLSVSGGILRVDNTFGFGATFNNTASTGMYITLSDTGNSSAVGTNNGNLLFYTNTNTTERMRLDSTGNLGLGVTPYAWGSGFTALDMRSYGSLASTTANTYFYANSYFNGTNWIYKQTAAATGYSQNTGQHVWFNAPSGTAGNPITFTQAMTLDASGNLGVGTAAPTFGSGGGVEIERSSSNATLRLQRTTTSTSTAEFRADASSVYLETRESVPLIFGINEVERMRLDSAGNLGLGVTPSAWGSTYRALDVRTAAVYDTSVGTASGLTFNAIFNGTNWVYKGTGGNATAIRYHMEGGQHQWYTAPSGTAGAAITFTQAMTLDASGNLGLGATSITALGSGYTTQAISGTNGAGIRLYAGATEYGRWYADATVGMIVQAVGATTPISLYTNSAERLRIDASGNVTPGVTNTQTLGAVGDVWSNVHATTFTGALSGNATTATSVGSLTGIATVAPLVAGTAAVGTSTLGARQDHVHPAQTTVSGNAGTVTNGVYTTDQVVTSRSTVLSTNSGDFNTYVTAGSYNVSGNGTWTGSTNGPTAAYPYGQLLVYVNGNIVTQQYFAHSNTGNFVRTKFNAADWQAWQEIWTDLNDGSGSGLDADLLDGLQSATANTASTIVARDASGNFSAGTITAALTGNASTATTLATARSINGTSFNGSADVTIGRIYDTSYRRITNPGGAEYVTTTASVTGAIAITLPVGMSGSMVSMTIKVYEYVTNESFQINCGGYNYATGSTWANNPFAYIVGSPGIDRRFTVRFGYDSVGLKAIIYIGELASTWSYPQVFVTDVQVGFGGQAVTWTSGWTIGFEATAFKNVTATITNPQVGYAVSTNTANSVALRDASGNFSAGTITAALSGNATTATSATNATNAAFLRQTDGTSILTPVQAITTSGARSTDLAPNTYNTGLFSEFKNAALYSTSGNYSGLITYANWLGTTASTGDPSYQLLFSPAAANSTAAPTLKIRAGIDTTWGAWSTILHSSNYNTYSPTLTGTGASGSWAIAITGNAATATSSTNLYGAGGSYIASSSAASTGYGSAIQIREIGLGGVQASAMAAAPRLAFHWSGLVASSIAMEASGRIGIFNNPGTSYEAFVCAGLTATTGTFNVATGTAPLSVASTTLVTNLNADLLDGLNSATANTASTIVARDASGNFSAGTITASLTGNASGSAATFTSTTQNSQFNSIGVGVAASTAAGTVTAPKFDIRRDTNLASGIRWYSNTLTAWQTYMSNAVASSGVGGNITAPAGTLVTSWALRNFIENVAGYGWTWESGTSTSTTPVVVAELRSSDGSMKLAGAISSPFHESVQTISTNYTITTGSNAMTPGPITIASGVTVTVPSGSVWTIV